MPNRQYYDRYQKFRTNNEVKVMPFIKIRMSGSDISVEYKKNTRLDILSQQYYGVPYYGWLIMQANPIFGGLEFDIPEGTIIRIPFPLISALQSYQEETDKYNTLYKIND